MTTKPLSVNEVIRMANHDFLNQLNLIQMNIDLDRPEHAKEVIKQFTQQCQAHSMINRLNLPLTAEWLHTVSWRFVALQVIITSNVDSSQPAELDEEIATYLENTIIHVYEKLDPFSEQTLQIAITSNVTHFKIEVHLTGQFEMLPFNKEMKKIKVTTYEQTNQSWKYVVESN